MVLIYYISIKNRQCFKLTNIISWIWRVSATCMQSFLDYLNTFPRLNKFDLCLPWCFFALWASLISIQIVYVRIFVVIWMKHSTKGTQQETKLLSKRIYLLFKYFKDSLDLTYYVIRKSNLHVVRIDRFVFIASMKC